MHFSYYKVFSHVSHSYVACLAGARYIFFLNLICFLKILLIVFHHLIIMG